MCERYYTLPNSAIDFEWGTCCAYGMLHKLILWIDPRYNPIDKKCNQPSIFNNPVKIFLIFTVVICKRNTSLHRLHMHNNQQPDFLS